MKDYDVKRNYRNVGLCISLASAAPPILLFEV